MPFNDFANRADTDQAALLIWKGIGLIIQIRIMPYAWLHLRVMDVYYALSQSVCQLYAFYALQNDRGDNSIWVFCIPHP